MDVQAEPGRRIRPDGEKKKREKVTPRRGKIEVDDNRKE